MTERVDSVYYANKYMHYAYMHVYLRIYMLIKRTPPPRGVSFLNGSHMKNRFSIWDSPTKDTRNVKCARDQCT